MSVAFTNQLRPYRNSCTPTIIRSIDVAWSSLGHECPSYMNHKAAIRRRMDIHVRRLYQPASPVEKFLHADNHSIH